MAGEQGSGAGGGTGVPSGTPPAAPAAPAAPVGGSPPAPQPRVIPEDVLPEAFRGKSPQEVKFLLGQMAQGFTQLTERVRSLEAQPPKREEPSKPAEPEKPIEEAILEDPEGTIVKIMTKHFGPVAQRIESGLEEVTESVTARDFDDWEDMKGDVYAVLREAGVPRTKANINQAYTLVVGQRTLAAKRMAAAAPHNPDIPVDGGTAPKLPELQGLELEIFEASGMSREDWRKYGDPQAVFDEIKVPTGKKVQNG